MFYYLRCLLVVFTLVSSIVYDVWALQDPSGQIWNTYWEIDFTQMSLQDLKTHFLIMQSPVQHSPGAVRQFEVSNTALDQAGVHITVLPALANGSVPCGGIYTKSNTFGFGAYYAEMQFPNVTGSVQAFYVYRSDNDEVDVERPNMNASSQVVDFTVKPQQYLPSGSPSNTTLQQIFPSFDMSAGFHNYSFVWNSTAAIFGVDGNYSAAIVTNVPQSPGVLSFSHWSDGNPNYSGGPPASPATMTVSRAWVWYNSSTPSPPNCQDPKSCSTAPPTSSERRSIVRKSWLGNMLILVTMCFIL